MEVQHHKHTHHKRLSQYFWDFFLLFIAISLSFVVENQREHFIEHKRMRKYLRNVMQDIKSNSIQLDSLIYENGKMLGNYDSLLVQLLHPSDHIDRYGFAKKLFPAYLRLFKNRKETFEQMIMTGSLRYLDDQTLLNSLVAYNRLADLTEWRAMENERKVALEQNYPDIYRNFDAVCLLLDIPGQQPRKDHNDILSGQEAATFSKEVSKAFILRIRFIRLSYDIYLKLKGESQRLAMQLEKFLS